MVDPPRPDLSRVEKALRVLERVAGEIVPDEEFERLHPATIDGIHELIDSAVHRAMEDAAPATGDYAYPPANSPKLAALIELRDSGLDCGGVVAEYLRELDIE